MVRVRVEVPGDVLGWVRVERPRETVEALGALVGSRISTEMTLALGLGVELGMLAVVDPGRPIDVALLGTEAAPRVVFSLCPRSPGEARTLLGERYRLVADPRVGERLEHREDAGAAGRAGLSCALVVTDDAVGSRVACASDVATLQRAGAWIAMRAVPHGSDAGAPMGIVGWMGEALVRKAQGVLRREARDGARSLEATAASARRARETPPTYGDPEVAARVLGAALGPWVEGLTALRALDFGAAVTAEGMRIRVEGRLQRGAAGRLAELLEARAERSVEGNPVTGFLPADAVWMGVDRADPAAQRAWLGELVAGGVEVLGARVRDPEAARRDLGALFAQNDGTAALAVSLGAAGDFELTGILPQADGGAAARAAVVRLGAAPWVRGLQLGGPLRVTAAGGALTLASEAPAPVAGDAGAGAGGVASLRLEVTEAGLVAVWGRHATGSMEALRARRGRDRMEATGGAATAVDALGAEMGIRLRVERAEGLRATLTAEVTARALSLVRERLGAGRSGSVRAP